MCRSLAIYSVAQRLCKSVSLRTIATSSLQTGGSQSLGSQGSVPSSGGRRGTIPGAFSPDR